MVEEEEEEKEEPGVEMMVLLGSSLMGGIAALRAPVLERDACRL